METLTPDEQHILDGLFAKSRLPGYDPALDTTEEERAIAARYILQCLHALSQLGVRSHLVLRPDEAA